VHVRTRDKERDKLKVSGTRPAKISAAVKDHKSKNEERFY